MKGNEKIFIDLLDFGVEKGLKGTDLLEVEEWAKEKYFPDPTGLGEKWIDLRSNLKYLFEECFHETNRIKKGTSICLRVLKNEYYFRLIEYQELQDSRIAAREANRNAFIAIGISIFAIIISAVLTFAQLNTPTIINKPDLNALIKSNRETGVQREVKLDSLQMAQILTAIGYNQSNLKVKRPKVIDQGEEISHYELINKYFEDE